MLRIDSFDSLRAYREARNLPLIDHRLAALSDYKLIYPCESIVRISEAVTRSGYSVTNENMFDVGLFRFGLLVVGVYSYREFEGGVVRIGQRLDISDENRNRSLNVQVRFDRRLNVEESVVYPSPDGHILRVRGI